RMSVSVLCAIVGVVAWVATSAGQGAQPAPGIGSGVAQVTGTVRISDLPPLQQAAPWKMSLEGTGNVRVVDKVAVATAEFVAPNTAYVVTWNDGSTESIVVLQAFSGGGVSARSGDRTRFLNLSV